MTKLKYIVFDVLGLQVPVVWPDDLGLTHKQVARSGWIGTTLSAGFTRPDTWETQGQSVSLALGPRPEDAELLRKYFTVQPVPPRHLPIVGNVGGAVVCPECGWTTFTGVPLGRCNRPGPMICRGIFPKKA